MICQTCGLVMVEIWDYDDLILECPHCRFWVPAGKDLKGYVQKRIQEVI